MSNATSNGSATRSPSTQIIEKAKRRRFSIEEKVRILREADACAPGTVGVARDNYPDRAATTILAGRSEVGDYAPVLRGGGGSPWP